MPKRTSIRGLGSDVWFTPTNETDNVAKTQEGHVTGKTVHQQDSKPVKRSLVKATFYLTSDHITALEEIKLMHLKERGERVDKSELVRRAINLLERQHASKTANQ